jgi:hypothetical protein
MKYSSPSKRSGRVTSPQSISSKKMKIKSDMQLRLSPNKMHIVKKMENNASSNKSKLCDVSIIPIS